MRRLGCYEPEQQRELRHRLLTEGVHWARVKNRVIYSEAAELLLMAHFGLGTRGGAIPLQSSPITCPSRLLESADSKKRPVLLEVVRSHELANRHVLICRLPGSQSLVTVQVRDNRNFVPGSATGRILAVHVTNYLWAFAGNPTSPNNSLPRCPRWKGKW